MTKIVKAIKINAIKIQEFIKVHNPQTLTHLKRTFQPQITI